MQTGAIINRGTTLIGASLCLTLRWRRFLLRSKARLPGEPLLLCRCGLHHPPLLFAGFNSLFPFFAFNHYIIAIMFLSPLHYLNIFL